MINIIQWSPFWDCCHRHSIFVIKYVIYNILTVRVSLLIDYKLNVIGVCKIKYKYALFHSLICFTAISLEKYQNVSDTFHLSL
jgi:hypothetical protein